jgi:D-alanyl-D-alanine carboxypeptidase (penicillin-binding protein 5/6)
VPIAGIAKVMTAMITLELRPLTGGQQGPEITVTDADQQAYRSAADNGESVVPVESGESLTEYQALQALLIGAGNNIAPLLSRWVAGSEARFVQLMNARARQLAMRQTTFADSGGISPQTVSVPADLVRLGEMSMANPVLAEIVGQKEATIPLMGPVANFNTAIGQSGIVGIKSGNLPSGASFLFAGSEQVSGGPLVMVYGALLGLPAPSDTFSAARALLDSARASLRTETIVVPGQPVGRYETGWGGAAPIIATQALAVLVWPGTAVTTRLDVRSLRPPVRAWTTVGTFHADVNGHGRGVPVALARALRPPGTRWRFQRGPV